MPFLLTINIFMKNSWICITLIDITPTGVTRGDSKERDQQRNWESVLQVLGLRAQPIIDEGPVKIADIDISPHHFGEFYEGVHRIWGFKFSADREEVYNLEQLEEDFDQVPVILGLDETARFMLPIFHSRGTLKNIHFMTPQELNTI